MRVASGDAAGQGRATGPGDAAREGAGSSVREVADAAERVAAPAGAAEARAGVLIARGVARVLAGHGLAALAEFTTPDGLRMDLCALGPTGEIWCVEVKSSRADFAADGKWPGYLVWCDRFFFAVPPGFPQAILPPEPGLIRADAWGGEVVRMAPAQPLAAARRRALTLRFARQAAERLGQRGGS